MGLADTFAKEDRVDVKFSDFYELVKGCTQRDMLVNAAKTEVPHAYIMAIMTGKTETQEVKNERP